MGGRGGLVRKWLRMSGLREAGIFLGGVNAGAGLRAEGGGPGLEALGRRARGDMPGRWMIVRGMRKARWRVDKSQHGFGGLRLFKKRQLAHCKWPDFPLKRAGPAAEFVEDLPQHRGPALRRF